MSKVIPAVVLAILSLTPAYSSEIWVTYRVPANKIEKLHNGGYFGPRPMIRYIGPTTETERREIVPDTEELRSYFRFLSWTWRKGEELPDAQNNEKWLQFSVRSDGKIPASSIQWITVEEAYRRNAMPLGELDYEKLGDALKNLGLDISTFDASWFNTMVDVRAERVARRFGEILSAKERAERARRLAQMPPEAQRIVRAEARFGRRAIRERVKR